MSMKNLQAACLWILEHGVVRFSRAENVCCRFKLNELERGLIKRALIMKGGNGKVKIGGTWFKACTT